jgi:hypothetical protein
MISSDEFVATGNMPESEYTSKSYDATSRGIVMVEFGTID